MAQIKKLKLNGKTIYPVTHPKAVIDPSSGRNIAAAATQSANGLMSAADKKKLDQLDFDNCIKTTGENQEINIGSIKLTTKASGSPITLDSVSGAHVTNITYLSEGTMMGQVGVTNGAVDKRIYIINSATQKYLSLRNNGTLTYGTNNDYKELAFVEDVNDIKANYVTTDTEQTIVGYKNFEGGVEICGTQISEGDPDRQIDLIVYGSFGANEFNIGQWSWLGDHFYYDGIDKEVIDLPEKTGTVALVEDLGTINGKFTAYLGDASIAIYQTQSGKGDGNPQTETACIQTSFDSQDPQTGDYPTRSTTQNRCVLALQPRGGNVGIGTISPTQKLHVVGNVLAKAFVTDSDVRLKENIQNIEASDERLQKAGEISLKSYTLKDDENGTIHYGYIAQEVEQLIPDVVLQGSPSDDNPDPMRGLNYIELLALKTAYLEKKNADLEARIQKLESLVAKLSQPETEV